MPRPPKRQLHDTVLNTIIQKAQEICVIIMYQNLVAFRSCINDLNRIMTIIMYYSNHASVSPDSRVGIVTG